MSKKSSYFALLIALSAAPWSSIFILLTPETPPLVIAFWRQILATIGTILLAYVFNQQNEFKNLDLSKLKLIALAGIFLGLHFGSWFISLFYTTVALSVTIVDSSPFFVALAGYFLLHERINRFQVTGIMISIIGGLILAFGSLTPFEQASNPIFGNFLALIGAITLSGYFIIGRLFRATHNMQIFSYTAIVYAFSSITLFILALIVSPYELIESLMFQLPWQAYFFFLLLAIGPSLLGHTMYNFALKDMKAVIISVVILGEPIVASILALVFLDQIPSILVIIGGVITLFGVGITIWMENSFDELNIDTSLN